MSTTTRVASPSAVLVRARCAHRRRRAATRRSRVEPARMGSSAGPAPAKKRFAVLDCEDAVKWDGHAIALSRLLGRAGETWEHHRCWSGELPDLREIHTYQGLVVTGSHYSTRDDHAHPWIGALKRFIAKTVVHGGVKVYGACFGCQVIAEALGGTVAPNTCGLPFVLKRETVVLTESFTDRPAFAAALAAFPPTALRKTGRSEKKNGGAAPARLAVLQAHGDCVVSLPNGATLLGSSATAPIEMFALGEDVLAVQGHPELDAGAMLANIAPFARALSDDEKAAAKSSLRLETDHITLVGVVRAFLRGDDGSGSGANAGANADGGDETDGKEQTDTPETLRRHAEAARAALSDTKRVKNAEAKGSKGSAASAASGAAAAAGAASVATSADQARKATSPPPPDVRLAERELGAAAEDAFVCAAHAAKDEVRVVSHEFATLARLNEAASAKYAELGGTVAGLGVFADSLRRKNSSVAPRFAELDAVEANLDALERAAGALEAEADRLEKRAGAVRALASRKAKELSEKSGGGESVDA